MRPAYFQSERAGPSSERVLCSQLHQKHTRNETCYSAHAVLWHRYDHELATVAAARSQSNLPIIGDCVDQRAHVPESGINKIRTATHSESAYCRPWVLTSSAAKGETFQVEDER